MAAHARISCPEHADGWAHQVSEPSPTPGTASIASHGAVSLHSPAGEGAAASPQAWSRSFQATADQVREGRQFLARILGDSPIAGDALACLSELAANSVLHSDSRRPGGYFAVHATLYPGGLRVEVEDEGGAWEHRHRLDGQCGRGLAIVEALSSEWAISGDGTGARTVWFEISYP
jgi:anti-sigma regulatory factor (Ser/Thr protein kinase)